MTEENKKIIMTPGFIAKPLDEKSYRIPAKVETIWQTNTYHDVKIQPSAWKGVAHMVITGYRKK